MDFKVVCCCCHLRLIWRGRECIKIFMNQYDSNSKRMGGVVTAWRVANLTKFKSVLPLKKRIDLLGLSAFFLNCHFKIYFCIGLRHCLVCGNENEENIILCSTCPRAYHTNCITPHMSKVILVNKKLFYDLARHPPLAVVSGCINGA